MGSLSIAEAKRHAISLARRSSRPVFYSDKAPELARARELSRTNDTVILARERMRSGGTVLGHDFYHAHRVALDAAAIVYCERGLADSSDGLARGALVAGYLHDIRRNKKDHAQRGAEAAGDIMRGILTEREISVIAFAIRDHEAFRERAATDDADALLAADALYDADKFRWGPDNFTYTIWSMARGMSLSVDDLARHFRAGIDGIMRIRDTFRTETGRRYGPDFIDRGLEIGEALYRILGGRDA